MTTAKLFDAANSGNIESIRKFHLQGGKVDCHSYMGITPLKAAFVSGDTKVGTFTSHHKTAICENSNGVFIVKPDVVLP